MKLDENAFQRSTVLVGEVMGVSTIFSFSKLSYNLTLDFKIDLLIASQHGPILPGQTSISDLLSFKKGKKKKFPQLPHKN